MSTSRRSFIGLTASTLAAATLGSNTVAASELEQSSTVNDFEATMQRARPVPLSNVRLTGGPLKLAQDVDGRYLLELEPDRMMAYYRRRAGLTQKAEPYAGWDGDGRNLTGHIAGHYLSAVSLMHVATGDARFKSRADYLVDELKTVQDKQGDGYLSALEGGRELWTSVSKGDIRSGGFDLNGLWSPWYTLHKTYAGLRDAYRYTGNRTALDVELKFADWAARVLAPMSDTQIQHMLNTEHGGMNEVLADLYADTGNRRWLELSFQFEHRAFTDALKRHQDNLNGKHGNCQIPKLIGSAARYGYNGDAGDLEAASFFWDRVTQHHTYASGGHGLAEYFGPADQLSPRVDGRTCETCNVYNMLKLTRRLFSLRPDAFYADFHERALFNHILASLNPQTSQSSYMVPVGRGVQQEYQNMLQSFTCCVGTGMESHALHGYGIYYESMRAANPTLWVNLFVPSTADFDSGVSMKMDTGFPDGENAAISLNLPSEKKFTLAVRRPSWAGDGFRIRVNGSNVEVPPLASLRAGSAGGRNVGTDDRLLQPSSFVEIDRTWKSGDMVEMVLPKALRLETTPDNRSVAAVMWGPLVLVGDLGPRQERVGPSTARPAPLLVSADRPVNEWILPAGTRLGDFVATKVAKLPAQPAAATDVSLTPFYRTHGRTYSLYFDVLTPTEFDSRVAAAAAEQERLRRLEAATIAFVQPGDPQAERNLNYQSDPSNRQIGRTDGRTSRGGTGWFSFDLPLNGAGNAALVVTYLNDLGLEPTTGNFQILVNGTEIARFQTNPSAVGFFDVQYSIPTSVISGKAKATARFQAVDNGRIAPVFGIRLIRP